MTHLVVVTGASRGIGSGIASAAEQAGATVAACNRSASERPLALVADLGEPDSWPVFAEWLDSLVDQTAPEKLTVVHNAATIAPIGFAGEVDPADYTSNVLLNAAAPQIIGDAVVRTAHRVQVPTVLVQLSSGAGKSPYTGWSSYCASKAAVDMWVRSVGLEQEQRGNLVRALALGPGVVATSMQAEIRSSDQHGFPDVEHFQELHSGGHLADPGEVGAAIWAIANQDSWSNGTVGDLSLLG